MLRPAYKNEHRNARGSHGFLSGSLGGTLAGALVVAGLALASGGAASARTEAPTLESFKNWSVHAPKNSPIKTCFSATGPVDTKTSQEIKSRGRAFLIVANFPDQGVKEQVAVTVGYPINTNSPITLKIDDRTFSMYADGEEAWLNAPEDDGKAVAAMRAGAKAWVTATSRRGTRITDEYSLIGFTNATKRAGEVCN